MNLSTVSTILKVGKFHGNQPGKLGIDNFSLQNEKKIIKMLIHYFAFSFFGIFFFSKLHYSIFETSI